MRERLNELEGTDESKKETSRPPRITTKWTAAAAKYPATTA